jgi:hypothetical protein
MQLDHDDMTQEKNIRKDILVAEIRAAAMAGAVDLNANAQSDYLDALAQIQSTDEFGQVMAFDQQKENEKSKINTDKNQIAREKISAQMKLKEMDLKIAQENQTKSELEAKRKLKERAKNKKK